VHCICCVLHFYTQLGHPSPSSRRLSLCLCAVSANLDLSCCLLSLCPWCVPPPLRCATLCSSLRLTSDIALSACAVCCSDLGKDASSRASTSPGGAFGSIEGRIDTLTAELERSIKEVRAQPLFATTCTRTWPQKTWPALLAIFGHPPLSTSRRSSLSQPCLSRRTQRSVQAQACA
jgi:hypothetical protein